MMGRFLFVFICTLQMASMSAQVMVAKNILIRFFSSTPIEDIEAKSNQGGSAINLQTRKVYTKVAIKSFKFKSGLMEEHFNENYLESDKYPHAEFDGIIQGEIDLNKESESLIKVSGKLTMHGMSKDIEVPVSIQSKNGKLMVKSVFKVKPQDYKIDIPKLVTKSIAEEIEVSTTAEFESKK